MGFTSIKGFFSYAHSDDRNEQLRALRDDLLHEYHMLTGEDLDLFFDRNSLSWGELWSESISSGIEASSFFIPILSPCYFQSPHCRQELAQYLAKAEELGVEDLVLPILYIDISREYLGLDETLIKRVSGFQYLDWTDLRFKSRESENYKRAINQMAERLITANQAVMEKVEVKQQELLAFDNTPSSEAEENEPEYFLESIAEIELLSDGLTKMLDDLTSEAQLIGEIVRKHTDSFEKANSRGQGAKVVLVIAKQMSDELTPVANRYEDVANDCSSLINTMDPKIKAITRGIGLMSADDGRVNEGIEAIKALSGVALETKEKLDDFANTIGPVKSLSRALYKPFKTIERATVICAGAFSVVVGWGRALN